MSNGLLGKGFDPQEAWGGFGPTGTGWMEFLEYSPEAAYYSDQPGYDQSARYGLKSPAAQRTYESSFSDIYNQYLGNLGSLVRDNKQGDYTPFYTWLEDTNPFMERYTSTSPQMRGGGYTSTYAPRTRQLYF